MNAKDNLWQRLLDEEKTRLSALPAEELIAMSAFTPGVIRKDGLLIDYGVWHETDREDFEPSREESQTLSAQLDRSLKVPNPRRTSHTFVLQARRRIFPGVYRNYLAGFSLDPQGKIFPASDDKLSAYD